MSATGPGFQYDSQEHMFQLIRALPDGVMVHIDGLIVLSNDAFARLHGLDSPDKLVGRSIYEFIPPSDHAYVRDHMDEVLSGVTHIHDLPIVLPGGESQWRQVTAKRVHLGGTVAVLSTMHDITERKRLEMQLRENEETLEAHVRQRTAELEAANSELESFCYSVSHDLRAPLRHVSGHISLLMTQGSVSKDAAACRHARSALSAVGRLGRLVDDLLHFSRMGRAELRNVRLSMSQLVEQVRLELEPDLQGREITWSVGALGDTRGDQAMLYQVWHNLIDNALKYSRTRAHSHIEIGQREAGDERVYFVRDNGVGFDPRYTDKLFGVFERLHQQAEFEGTGIGLANVHRIVQRHGGRVWAEGAVDAGATFYFALPHDDG